MADRITTGEVLDLSSEPVQRAYLAEGFRILCLIAAVAAVWLPPTLIERILLPAVFLLMAGAVGIVRPWGKVRLGTPRRVRGTNLELSRPFMTRNRIDLAESTEVAGREGAWVDTRGRWGEFFYEWRIVIAHPAGWRCADEPGQEGAVTHLVANGCPRDVARRWVDAQERVIFIGCRNDRPIAAVTAIRQIVDSNGGRIHPSFDRTLDGAGDVFSRRGAEVRRLERLRATRWTPWRRFSRGAPPA